MYESTISIKYTKSYDKTSKKLKTHHNELINQEKIISIIKNSQNIPELINNPLSKMYNLEQLKYQLNAYHSFNLEKNGGTIRLIIRLVPELNEVELIYVSFDHYKDFSEDKVIYYDE